MMYRDIGFFAIDWVRSQDFGKDVAMGDDHNEQLVPSEDVVRKFVEEALDQGDQFDQEVIDLVKKHFAQASLHSKTGARLAGELIALANVRAKKDFR